ncbi:MAG TPA: SMP-30/gluconolactonase/LRE family protein [Gammaproteobacteria bacterium]|nr:SMP-30/gluconolactonase/LRE family protein [Gammaproteobacteria bacterium]
MAVKIHKFATRALAVCSAAYILAVVGSPAAALDLGTFESMDSGARAALEKHDYKTALAGFQALLKISPDHPDILLGRAHSEAGLGKSDEAYRDFERIVRQGLGAELPQDTAFLNLHNHAGYSTVLAEAQDQSRPIVNAQAMFTLPERDFIPEGMAYDATTLRFFFSSTYLRKIVSRSSAGIFDVFASADKGLWQALGMKIDSQHGWLLACSGADSPNMTGFQKSDIGKSGVFIFDLKSGKLVARYDAPPQGIHLFNDLVIGPRNDVYITDSDEGSVYKLDLAGRRITRLTAVNTFLYPNGIALSPDGSNLYVADEGVGIDLVNLQTGAVRRLPHPEDITTVGIDGLYFYKGYLIATQTDLHPNRVIAFQLSPDLEEIIGSTVIERGDPRMSSPTEGVVVGDSLYFIANSEQNSFDQHGHIWPNSKLTNTQILKVALPDN